MSRVALPTKGPLLGGRGWTAFFVALIALCALAPVLNLWVPAGSAFHLSDYAVALVGKIMCYAICALAMDLIWGYTGILSLGHGLFFALGGYMMGMYLMRQIGRDGNYKSDLPDFMVFLDWKELPWHWTFSGSFGMTLFALTGLTLLGFFLFARWLIGSKFGRVLQAIRDAETRVMFSGYNPLPYKLTIWVISAVMCGVAGALYVPHITAEMTQIVSL